MNKSRLSQNQSDSQMPPMVSRYEAPPAIPQNGVKPVSFHIILWPAVANLLLSITGFIVMVCNPPHTYCSGYNYGYWSYETATPDAYWAGLWMTVGGAVIGLVATVYVCVVLYRAWTAIQSSAPRTTPGKAVGFLFIPFFALYWIFQAYAGWAKDYNKHLVQTGVDRPDKRASEGLFLTQCILICCLLLPLVNFLAILALIPIGLVCLSQLCRGVNYLATGK